MKKLVIANLKSHKTRNEMTSWVSDLQAALQKTPKLVTACELAVAPPFPFLGEVEYRLSSTPEVKLAVQDISSFPAGAYTGAVSSHNLEGYAVTFAIVGHSERRRYFHETNQEIANKVHEALGIGIQPVVCVTRDQVLAQANAIDPEDRSRVLVAFEPEEHIGTGVSDTIDHILETCTLVREGFGDVPYIYGGSANPQTPAEILHHPDIAGFLVGTASLEVPTLVSLLTHIES